MKPNDLPVSFFTVPPDADEDPGDGGGGLKHYILRFRRIVVVSLLTWARWYVRGQQVLGRNSDGRVRISTVFLGLDHSFGYVRAKPVLFESMIFGGKHDQYQNRYYSLAEALRHHRQLVRRELGVRIGRTRNYLQRKRVNRKFRPRIKYPFHHRIERRK